MDIYSWVIFMYIAGTVIVGWLLLSEVSFLQKRKKDKLVGPTYWGIYNDALCADLDGHMTIKIQEVALDEENAGLCGGSSYAGGRAVTTARV